MTKYLLKVHLQTFLSRPVNKKCQILICDTLVASERYQGSQNYSNFKLQLLRAPFFSKGKDTRCDISAYYTYLPIYYLIQCSHFTARILSPLLSQFISQMSRCHTIVLFSWY